MTVLPGQLSLDLETAVVSWPPHGQGDPRPRRRTPDETRNDHAPRERELLSVSEVSRITGLSANAIYRPIWSGELCASKLRGRLRVQAADVRAWVVASRVTVTHAAREPPPARARRPRAAGRGRGLRDLLHAATPRPG
jgi:excisionase family DNA binding protein